jgi:ribosomal subunit interface protein
MLLFRVAVAAALGLTPPDPVHKVRSHARPSGSLSARPAVSNDAVEPMQVTVTGKQFDVGDSLRSHATAMTVAIVEKYFDRAIEAHAGFCRERHLVHVELSVHAGRGLLVQCAHAAADPYAAFDGAAERLDKRLRRHKRRLRNRHGRGGKDAAEAENLEDGSPETALVATTYILAGSDEADPASPEAGTDESESEDGEPLVIAEMRSAIPELSVSEAVMQLDLTDAPALLFRNRAHGNLNMIYRRRDGNIGWIDPDFVENPDRSGAKVA